MVLKTTIRFYLAVAAINALLNFTVAYVQEQLMSEVKLTVYDQSGAVIPDSEVVFKSDSSKIVSRAGPDGTAAVKLPSGKYYALVSKHGFVTTKLADIQITPPTASSFRVELKVDSTPIYDPMVSLEGVPTAASDLPNVIEPDSTSVPIHPAKREVRSLRCLYLWKCSKV